MGGSQSDAALTVLFQEGSDKRINAHKFQLNVVSIERDPLPPGELLDDDAELLGGDRGEQGVSTQCPPSRAAVPHLPLGGAVVRTFINRKP